MKQIGTMWVFEERETEVEDEDEGESRQGNNKNKNNWHFGSTTTLFELVPVGCHISNSHAAHTFLLFLINFSRVGSAGDGGWHESVGNAGAANTLFNDEHHGLK